MPNLRTLLEELDESGTDPRDVFIPAVIYDTIMSSAEEDDSEGDEGED